MLNREARVARGQHSVRGLPLLEGERLEELFVPYDGLVSDTPRKGQLLALTNQRVISFLQSDGNKETFVAPLDELRGVAVKANIRGLKHLSQGLIVMLLGVFAYFIVGYILDGVAIAAAIGAGIIFVGVLFLGRYFLWEEEGTVTFQGGSWELCFPFKSNMASACVYTLVNRFFELKLGSNAHHPPSGEESGDYPSGPPFAPPSTESSYYI